MKKKFFEGLSVLFLAFSPLFGDENTPILTQTLATEQKNSLTNLQNLTQLNFIGQLGQVSSIRLDAKDALDRGERKLTNDLGAGPLLKKTIHVGRKCIDNMIDKLGIKVKLPDVGEICGVNLTNFVYDYIANDLKKTFGLKSLSWNIDILEYLKKDVEKKVENEKSIERGYNVSIKATKDSKLQQQIEISCKEYKKLKGKKEKQQEVIEKNKKIFGDEFNKQQLEAQCLIINSPTSKELVNSYLKSLKGDNIFDLSNSAITTNKQKQIITTIKNDLLKQTKFINETTQHNKQDNNFLTQDVDTSVLIPLPIFKFIPAPGIAAQTDETSCTIINEDTHKIMKEIFSDSNKECSIPQLSIEMVSSSNINKENQVVKDYNKGIENYLKFQEKLIDDSKIFKNFKKNIDSLKIDSKDNKDYILNYPQILMLAQLFNKVVNNSYLLDAPLEIQKRLQNNQVITNLQLFVLNNQVYNIQKHQRKFELKNAIIQQNSSKMILTELKKQNVILVNLLTKILNK